MWMKAGLSASENKIYISPVDKVRTKHFQIIKLLLCPFFSSLEQYLIGRPWSPGEYMTWTLHTVNDMFDLNYSDNQSYTP